MQDNYNSKISPTALREIIDRSFRAAGFDAAGVASLELLDANTVHLREWLDAGMHADMDYMQRTADIRGDLRALMPEVRSVVVTLTSYRNVPAQADGVPRIAAFARAADYHIVIKDRLHDLLATIQKEYPAVKGRAVVDSAPAFEREWAVRASLGWIGRSSMLVNPALGSFVLIGLLLLDHRVTPCEPFGENLCGQCRSCVESCPTGAINDNCTIDSRRCLAYQTIENRGAIGDEYVEFIDGRIFGCDSCMEACPYNSGAYDVVAGLPCQDFVSPTQAEWLTMSIDEFARRFGSTPLSRIGLERIVSNILAQWD